MTTTDDPYVRVEREDLRIGMRFDYRLPGEAYDQHVRRLTSLDPIEYDWDARRVRLSEDDLTDREFYAHCDDITLVPTLVPVAEARVGEPIAINVPSSPEGRARMLNRRARTFVGVNPRERIDFQENGSECTTAGQYTHVWVLRPERAEAEPEATEPVVDEGEPSEVETAYQAGVRDGYSKALQRRRAESDHRTERATGMADRPAFRREDAVVLAIQALGGSDAASHALIPLARQIEAYVNGTTAQPQRVNADALEALPLGSIVRDRDGDYWRKTEPSPRGACWAIGGRRLTDEFRDHPGRSSASLAASYSPLHLATAIEADA